MSSIEGLINIARKAGFVIVGGENLTNYQKKLYLLVMDVTAGNSLKREMQFLSSKRGVELLTIENLAQIVGIENCKAIGIKNKAFADNIAKNIKGE